MLISLLAVKKKKKMACPLLLAALVILMASESTSEQCYRFKFPKEFQNVIIRATEGSTITLPAKLDTDACAGSWNEDIDVYVKHPPNDKGLRQLFCGVTFGQRSCKPSNSERCSCLEDDFGDTGVNFTKTVSKSDSGSWLWSTGDGLMMEINFDIREGTTTDSTERVVTKATSQTSKDVTTQNVNTEDTQSDTTLRETSPTPPIVVTEKANPGDNPVKTGLISGSVNIVIAITIVLVVFLCRRRRRAREVKARCTVNFTPVLEVNEDVLTWAQRRDNPNDVGRSTSYVSFGGIMTLSNENIPQAHRNEGYLATSPSPSSKSPMDHP